MSWRTSRLIPTFRGDVLAGTTVVILAEYLDAQGDSLLNLKTTGGHEVFGIGVDAIEYIEDQTECPWS